MPPDVHNRGSGSVDLTGTIFGLLLNSFMQRLIEAGAEELVIWTAVLAISLAVVAYVIGKVRAKTVQQELTTSELMAKFRELHSRGQLNDEEFRTIKTTLATKLQDELKGNGETG